MVYLSGSGAGRGEPHQPPIGKIISAGFKGAKDAVEVELAGLKAENASVEATDTAKNPTKTSEVSSEDFEN